MSYFDTRKHKAHKQLKGEIKTMPKNFTTYLENKILDHCLGTATFAKPSVYVGLFSVAPTDGNSKLITAPFNPFGALAIIKPCSKVITAPMSVKPFIW